MKRKFKAAAVLLTMSMAAAPLAGVTAGAAPDGYDYYHQEFTNNTGTEKRLKAGAQEDLNGWTVRYPTDGTFNIQDAKPEGVYIAENGTLRLKAYGTHSSAADDLLPAANLDYSDFSGKDGNYTISFKMNIVNGNRAMISVGKASAGLANQNTAYGITPQLNQKWQYRPESASTNTDLYDINASAAAKPVANQWYDVQMYINNTDKKFNVWINGVPQKDGSNSSTELSLNKNYAEEYVNPSVLTFSISPSNSSGGSLMTLEIDDLRIMPGKYDLLYQNSEWSSNMPAFKRATGEKKPIENSAKYSEDNSLSLVGASDTSNSDYNVQFKYNLDATGSKRPIDEARPVVTEILFMPIENVGQVYFTQQEGKSISYRINPSNLRPGGWNKIKFVYTPAHDDQPLTSEIYLNGQRCYEHAFTGDKSVAVPQWTVLCVSKNPDENQGDPTTDNLQNVKCAVDDVKIYQTDKEDALTEKYPTFTSSLSTSSLSWIADSVSDAAKDGGDLYIPKELKVSEIAAQVGSDTEIRLFESDLSTPIDTAAEGTKLVLVSPTGVYSYYTVHILDIKFTGAAVAEHESDSQVSNGELTATVNGTEKIHGELVLAVFDTEGRLVEAKPATKQDTGNYSVTLTITDETDKVIAFLWQDLEASVLPIMNQKILTKASAD